MDGATSHVLDTKAKFLYLYQIVNDRGTNEIIRTNILDLECDPALITSWGHFYGYGFYTVGPGTEEVRPTASGEGEEKIAPISFANPLATGRPPTRTYRKEADHTLAPSLLAIGPESARIFSSLSESVCTARRSVSSSS